MADVSTGRHTAALDDEIVVFIIGMRINRLRRPSWLPAFRAMPRMLRELAADLSLGLLNVQTFWGGRVIVGVQYWRSFDQLEAFAGRPTTSICPRGGSSTDSFVTTPTSASSTRRTESARAPRRPSTGTCRRSGWRPLSGSCLSPSAGNPPRAAWARPRRMNRRSRPTDRRSRRPRPRHRDRPRDRGADVEVHAERARRPRRVAGP